MRIFTSLALAGLLAATGAAAQDSGAAAPAPEQSTPTAAELLRAGFTIADMQYLNSSIVVILQRFSVAYICDLTLNGETKICVEVK